MCCWVHIFRWTGDKCCTSHHRHHIIHYPRRMEKQGSQLIKYLKFDVQSEADEKPLSILFIGKPLNQLLFWYEIVRWNVLGHRNVSHTVSAFSQFQPIRYVGWTHAQMCSPFTMPNKTNNQSESNGLEEEEEGEAKGSGERDRTNRFHTWSTFSVTAPRWWGDLAVRRRSGYGRQNLAHPKNLYYKR